MNNELISKTINNIRFPMMMGVVMIHAKIVAGESATFENVQEVLSNLIPSPCVPIFFLMSGFLFFWKIADMTGAVYANKMKKRVRSLLVPYLIWNCITICAFACMHLFLPNLVNPEFENVPSWNWTNYFNAFWNGSGGFPISYPLWFLRDLIVLIILSPLFYLCVYKMGRIRWLVLLALCGFYYHDNYGVTFGIFYFYIGTMLAYLVRSNKLPKMSFSTLKFLMGGVIIVYTSMIVMAMITESLPLWHNPMMRISGTIAYILIFIMLTEKGLSVPHWLSACSFFVYLYHALPLMVTGRVLVMILKPDTLIMLIISYILNVMIIVGGGILIYYILSKFFPRLTSVICGGR